MDCACQHQVRNTAQVRRFGRLGRTLQYKLGRLLVGIDGGLELARDHVECLLVLTVLNGFDFGQGGTHLLRQPNGYRAPVAQHFAADEVVGLDRKSTRLNSSHVKISYAVFCLKKKKTTNNKI